MDTIALINADPKLKIQTKSIIERWKPEARIIFAGFGRLGIWAILLFLISEPVISNNNIHLNFSDIQDTIITGCEPDYPPYCFINSNGQPDGFSIELFKAALKASGLNAKIDIGIWNILKHKLAVGELDALPMVGRTPERDSLFDFTVPYLSLHGAVFVRKGTSDIQSLEDLKNKELVVMKGDNAEEFLRRENISTKIFTTNTFEEAFQQLADGSYDAIVTQRITGINLIQQLKLKSVVPLDFHIPQFRQDFCFAVKKGDTQLLNRMNEGLSIIIANDTYQVIRTKWLGPVVKEKLDFVDILKIGVLVAVPIAVLLFLALIFLLRREVSRKTRNLNQEITEHKKTLESLTIKQELLKKSEQQIRLLLNSTAEGIYGLNINGICTFINQSALKILGYTEPEELIGKNIHYLMHHTRTDGTTCELGDCKIFNAINNGEKMHCEDEIFWRSNGTSFPVEYFSYPIQQNDEIIGLVVTFWDITERKQAENELVNLKNELERKVVDRTIELEEKVQKLNRSQKAMLEMVEDLNMITSELKAERQKLELSNRELDAFTYSVSHDLKAPLRAIKGFAGFLSEDFGSTLGDEGNRYITVISQNVTKMENLISSLLNLSRVSRTEIRKSLVKMEPIVYSMYNEMATDSEKGLFEFKVKKLPPVKCDHILLKQVWQNLIGNALKYSSKSKTKSITIGAKENENDIVYYIEDKGAGFDSKYSHKLFDVFQRLHKEDDFDGTGVGLAIVNRIIQRHGGTVWAEGIPEKGAKFYFSLPKSGISSDLT